MQKGDYLNTILKSPKTVFTLKDIILLWQDTDVSAMKVRLHYYVKKGQLLRIRRGVYTKDTTYNKLELATRIFTPSYVSFESVLAKEGLIFQFYKNITVAAYVSRPIEIEGQTYIYRQVKNSVLINGIGINHINETSIASKERAFLDTLYSNIDYHFDNLRSIDWKRVFEILPIYNNKRMSKKVELLYKEVQKTASL